MNVDTLEALKKLSYDRVWVTKKVRMESEARLNRNNYLSMFLINYYTFIVLALSIGTLLSENNNMALFTVIAAVALFGVSLFISYVRFRERALDYKESYIKLNELEADIKQVILKNQEFTESQLVDKLHSCELKYSDILAKTENHASIDYQKVVVEKGLQSNKKIVIEYYFNVIVKYIIITLFIITPLILLLPLILNGVFW